MVEQNRVVLAADNDYFQYLYVTLTSLIQNNPNLLFDIHMLDGGISLTNKQHLDELLAKSGNVTILYHDVKKLENRNFHISGHVNYMTYARLLIPELLPDISKVLYIDCDIVINGSIDELLKIDIEDHCLAAVCEPMDLERFKELSIVQPKYFNAGVLLINLDKWRQEKITEQVFNIIKKWGTSLNYHDQDALNIVIQDFKEVEMKWNFTSSHLMLMPLTSGKSLKIVHFTNSLKPWMKDCGNKFYYLYYKYLLRTPWVRLNSLLIFCYLSLKFSVKRIVASSNIVFSKSVF